MLKNVLKNFQMSEQYWGCLDKKSGVNFSPAETLEYSMIVKLLTKHHLEFLNLIRGCTCSSESTHVKMPHCRKSHVAAHI